MGDFRAVSPKHTLILLDKRKKQTRILSLFYSTQAQNYVKRRILSLIFYSQIIICIYFELFKSFCTLTSDNIYRIALILFIINFEM